MLNYKKRGSMRYGIFDAHGRMLFRTLDEARHRMMHEMEEHGKLRVLMLYDRETMLHEIASTAWVETDTAIQNDEATDKGTHNYKEVAEEENWPMVSRWIALGVTEVEQLLYNLTKHNTHEHRSMDNAVPERREWAIEMRVKPEASDTSVTLIMNLAGEYLKAKVLEEWSGLSYPAKHPYWASEVEKLAEKLREAGRSCDSIHNIRRPMWPAW